MTDQFSRAVEIVLSKEGVLSDDPRDNGGLTKYGISQKAYPALDIRALTRDAAIDLYRRDYWQPVRGDDLAWAFALPLFDCAVNQGVGRAIRMFQAALNVTADGSFGPATLKAAQSRQTDPTDTLARFMAERALAYAQHADFSTFGRGWMRRAFSITQTARA